MSRSDALRIGLVLDRFDPERGGAEKYLARLLLELKLRNHKPRVYCLEGEGPRALLEVVLVSTRARSRARRELQFAQNAAAQARRDRCDVLFGVRHILEADLYQPHGGTWAASTEARRRLHRWPLGHRVARALSPKHRYFARADRQVFLDNPKMITVAVSPLVKNDVLKRYGEFSPRVEVVWPAVDAQRFHPGVREQGQRLRRKWGLDGAGTLLLFAAHEFKLKGLAALLAAFKGFLARREQVLLVVAGRGRRQPYEALARKLGVEHRVRWEPRVQDMAPLYGAADALVHPTYFDPCALVTLEALACGVPVVTTRLNGAAPLVERAGGEILERPGDPEKLAAAMERAASKEGATCGPEVIQECTWPRHVPIMESLLFEAASARVCG